MARRISVDPVTRIEGHLRVDCSVADGRVDKAWASGQMWRGIELILRDRDPREAWLFAQRICGVCTTVHAIASVRAVENALGLPVPPNAQYIRNLIQGAHGLHDHIVHFYQLSALDWVDITHALKADPKKAAALARSLSDWHRNSDSEFQDVARKLKSFVDSGQLGVFGTGYWDHPAMTLSPEANLMALVHYFQALEYQRVANKIVTVLGSKTPHIQNLAVGGVTNPINMDAQSVLNLERLQYIKSLIDELDAFTKQVYVPDVAAIGGLYADWTKYGKGITNYLSAPDMPLDEKGEKLALPGGYIRNGDVGTYQPIQGFNDAYFEKGVKEAVKHAWYSYSEGDETPLHPYDGETQPNHTEFQDDGKYSWVKSPTFHGERAQVGPLANVLCLYAAGHEGTKQYANAVLDTASETAGTKVGLDALHSTIGRHAARAIRGAVLTDTLSDQWQHLMDNIASGDTTTCNQPEFPDGEVQGYGFHEAPRGILSHWVVIRDGRIANYQAVVPTTWNAGPRDEQDRQGPYEAALLDNPVADPEQPLEVLRTVHSFDPCLACAIHLTDADGGPAVKINTR